MRESRTSNGWNGSGGGGEEARQHGNSTGSDRGCPCTTQGKTEATVGCIAPLNPSYVQCKHNRAVRKTKMEPESADLLRTLPRKPRHESPQICHPRSRVVPRATLSCVAPLGLPLFSQGEASEIKNKTKKETVTRKKHSKLRVPRNAIQQRRARVGTNNVLPAIARGQHRSSAHKRSRSKPTPHRFLTRSSNAWPFFAT